MIVNIFMFHNDAIIENLPRGRRTNTLNVMGEYVSIKEFCEYFSVPEQTVRRWLRFGQLPGLKMGRMWRISKDTIQKIESGELKIEDPEGEGDGE